VIGPLKLRVLTVSILKHLSRPEIKIKVNFGMKCDVVELL